MPSKNKSKKKIASKNRKSTPQGSLKTYRAGGNSPLEHDVGVYTTSQDESDSKLVSTSSFDQDSLSNSLSDGDPEGEDSEETREQEGDSRIRSSSPSASTQRSRNTPFQRSQSYGPEIFAPPFYNRPPSPLPPSPSLSSLLRSRPFNTSLSRTTTPESSDTEATGNLASSQVTLSSTEAAVAQSAQAATMVPRASPKVPTYEYYGFVLYIGSSAAFLVYLLWSYLPAAFLNKLGIYYYPNRWWSLAIPAWLVVLVIYIYVALAAWNTGRMTLPLGNIECLVDEKAQVAVIDSSGKIVRDHGSKDGQVSDRPISYGRAGIGASDQNGIQNKAARLPELNWRRVWDEGTDGVMDIPIGGVCEILYGTSRE